MSKSTDYEDDAISCGTMVEQQQQPQQQQTEEIKWTDKVTAATEETTHLPARRSSTVSSVSVAAANEPLITGEGKCCRRSSSVDQQNGVLLQNGAQDNLKVTYSSSSNSCTTESDSDHCTSAEDDQQILMSNNTEQLQPEKNVRQKSLRRKKSFHRVRLLFEPPSAPVALRQHSLPAFHRPQLGRPLSVNLPLTSRTSEDASPAFADMSPAQSSNYLSGRRRSNADLDCASTDHNNNSGSSSSLKRARSPISLRLSTSSTSIINDLIIIPKKTVYENVCFFESKSVQQSTGRPPAQSYSRSAREETVPQHEKVQLSTAKLPVKQQQRMRSSASADDILQQHQEQQQQQEQEKAAAESMTTTIKCEESKHEHEPTIRDLFYHRYEKVNGAKTEQQQQQQQQSKSEPHLLQMQTQQSLTAADMTFQRTSRSVACQTEKEENVVLVVEEEEEKKQAISPPRQDQESPPVQVYIHIDSDSVGSAPSPSVFPTSLSRTTKRRQKSTSRNNRHRLRPSRSHCSVNVQISTSSSLVTTASTTSSQLPPLASFPTEYHLRLSPLALGNFLSKLDRLGQQHSSQQQQQPAEDRGCAMKGEAKEAVTSNADDEEDNSMRTESPVPVNLLHRDSIANGFSSSPRWKDRRKAVYRRNLSLNEYLTRALQQEGTTMLKFQSEYPWRSFVQSGRHANQLNDLKTEEVHLYESLFEIILTERTHLSHLGELSNFAESAPSLKNVISAYDRHLLFGGAAQLYATTCALFDELESAFNVDIFMSSSCTILTNYLSTGRMEGYIDFIKGTDERNRLLAEKGTKLLTPPESTRLNSLLIMPMQRVTRYPLLLKNVLDQVDKLTVKLPMAKLPNRSIIEKCYTAATLFAVRCNQALVDERNLYDLVCFKKQIAGGMRIPDLVCTTRQIVLQSAVKVQRRIGIKVVASPNSGRPVEHSAAKDVRLKAMLVLLTDMLILAEIKWRKNQYNILDFSSHHNVEFIRHNETHSSGFSLSSAGLSDMDSFETMSLSDYSIVPQTPTTPGTPLFASSVIRFSKDDHCTNIYVIAFASSEDEDKFANEFKRLKAEHGDRFQQPPPPTLRRLRSSTSPGGRSSSQNGASNRLSTISANSLYYSDGDSRSTNSSDIDYLATA
ncbi:Rho guanine nucleotide exchange factor 26 [Tyrophagus putrescentiae]|nr:Rho guanine nucleotide exchange factor 26 [Tyrophagus putrescentiae]